MTCADPRALMRSEVQTQKESKTMQRLTCEVCGGTDLIKTEGIFECQNCGCKYTLQEARSLFANEEVRVKGTVEIDQSNALAGYLEMAKHAFEANNCEEAKEYASKVLEADASNAEAWFLKGAAVGRLISIKSDKIEQVMYCFAKSIGASSEETLEQRKEQVASELQSLVSLWIRPRLDALRETPRKKKPDKTIRLAKQVLAHVEQAVDPDVYKRVANATAEELSVFVEEACEDITSRYDPECPNQEYAMWYSVSVMENCLCLVDASTQMNIECFQRNLAVAMLFKVYVGMCAEHAHQRENRYLLFREDYSSELGSLQRLDLECDELISRLEPLAHAQDIQAYWEEHAQEKSELLARIEACEVELSALEQADAYRANVAQLAALESEKGRLYAAIAATGLFQLSERKKLELDVGNVVRAMEPLKESVQNANEQIASKRASLESMQAHLEDSLMRCLAVGST